MTTTARRVTIPAPARLGTLVLILALVPDAGAGSPEPEVGRLRAHVATLASDAFAGRRGEGARKAESYVELAFRRLGLRPLFGDDYTQEIATTDGRFLGRNVGARLDGTDPALKDEWIIVGAHFDHLGVINGMLYPGADDNATAVAMMLEVARALVQSDAKPRRSVMFVGFDREEDGLFGSRYFVEHMAVPLDQVKLFITGDMLGRSLGGVCDEHVFVIGTEHTPGLRPWVQQATQPESAYNFGLLGNDLLGVDRSDYGPFRMRHVPYLFFSTGENPHYHRPTDTADTIDYDKVAAASRAIARIVRSAANADEMPAWQEQADNPLAEAVLLRDVIRRLLDHRGELAIKPAVAALMSGTIRRLDGIIARGRVTPAERTGLLRVAQVVLFSVL